MMPPQEPIPMPIEGAQPPLPTEEEAVPLEANQGVVL